ncbi:hypothetical protein B6S12_03950 [Helicobacter valdiviensis]|uniref:Uncharacterized protein n=1 Tax=Helicobacter valdiviensis TaxID=1458358 RepID=A0A2W6NHZ6_9HELI|nr:hypothetical protein [Helicobacter valdiviensis]PZT48490.1 hypothetical protein B6S12_03950 [Helicobacter valdiviensis]
MRKYFLLLLLGIGLAFAGIYDKCLPSEMDFKLDDNIKKLKGQGLIKIIQEDGKKYEEYHLYKDIRLFVKNGRIEAVREKDSNLLKEPAQSDFLINNGYSLVETIDDVEVYENVFCTFAVNNAENFVTIMKPSEREVNLPLIKIEKECLPDGYNIYLGEELKSVEKKLLIMNPVGPDKNFIKSKDDPDALFLTRANRSFMLISFKDNRLIAIVILSSPLSKGDNFRKFLKNKKYHLVEENEEGESYRAGNCAVIKDKEYGLISIISISHLR